MNPVTVTLVDLTGNKTGNAPEWTFNRHAAYFFQIANEGQVVIAGNVSYKTDQYHTEFNDPRMLTDAYTLADAKITTLRRSNNRRLRSGCSMKSMKT